MQQLWRNFGNLFPLLVIAALAGAVVLWLLGRVSAVSRLRLIRVALGVWLVAVAAVTLLPTGPVGRRSVDLVPFRSLYRLVFDSIDWQVPAVQIVGNLVLFLPLGVLLPLASQRAWNTPIRVICVSAAAATIVETLQWVLAIGRGTAIDDVTNAVLGAVLGWIVVRCVPRLHPQRLPSRDLSPT